VNPYDIDDPSLDTFTVQVTPAAPPDPGATPAQPTSYSSFLSYEFADDFLTPVDGWRFSLDGAELQTADWAALVPGSYVRMQISGQTFAQGLVDDVHVHGGRSGGTIVDVEGRNWLSPAVDAHVDPGLRFPTQVGLDKLLLTTLGPFGVKYLAEDNYANRNAVTGSAAGSANADQPPLSAYVSTSIMPYPHEGAWAFCSRVAQRFGVWIWPAADGQTLVCSVPDYGQDPRYQLVQSRDPAVSPTNNVEDFSVRASRRDQPSLILATGFGGGGAQPKATYKWGVLNPCIITNESYFAAVLAAYKSVQWAYAFPLLKSLLDGAQSPYVDPGARPLYLVDKESHTGASLFAFLLRELSLRTRKALTATYTVMGHRLGGQAICVDTIIDVQDDYGRLHAPMWVAGVRYHMAPGQTGGRTTIELLRPGTLVFSAVGDKKRDRSTASVRNQATVPAGITAAGVSATPPNTSNANG
jgi:prophage tail gpP-like protein